MDAPRSGTDSSKQLTVIVQRHRPCSKRSKVQTPQVMPWQLRRQLSPPQRRIWRSVKYDMPSGAENKRSWIRSWS